MCYPAGMTARRSGNVLDEGCPSRVVLDLIADKWVALVIHALARRTWRHQELRRAIGGISQKMLTQTLRQLERHGVVHREVYAEVPPRVEYSLTPLGRSLLGPLDTVCAWAESNWERVRAARGR
jgi:DNA-binding HxlR family transcriptional regulator